MKVIGVDLGFGFTKATDGNRSLVFKSVIGEADSQQFAGESLLQPAGEDHLHFEFDDRTVFVGDLAERQSNVRSFTLDQDRFIADSAKTLALAAASGMVDGEREPIGLVTGLPISEYKDKTDELVALLLGTHRFTTVQPDGGRREVTLDIAEVRAIPQPFGSMYELLLGENGEIVDRRMMQEKIGIIDIGFQTADFTISDHTNFLERGSRSTDSGIARAFTVIATKLREKSGVNVEIYRLYDAVEQGRIKIRGNSFDLQKLTDHVVSQLATDIATEANELWADDWDIDSIVVTGGGGAVLAPYLSPLVHGRVLPMDNAKDYRLNNVNGFLAYGRHLWSNGAQAPAPAAPEPAEQPAAQTTEPAPAAPRVTAGMPY